MKTIKVVENGVTFDAVLEEKKQKEINVTPEMKFGSEINFTELFIYVKQFTGQDLTFTNPKVKCVNGYWRIEWKSSSIDPASLGVFGKILDYCIVEPFNSQIIKIDNVCRYWSTVHISYQHKDGGSNGMKLFTAIHEDGKWLFRNIGE